MGCLARAATRSLKFRRQVWIDAYIADFLCYEARLIVELDGSQHGEAVKYDDRRDAEWHVSVSDAALLEQRRERELGRSA